MNEDYSRLARFLQAPIWTVVGYHATSARVAKAILAGRPFRLSRNPYDWLGTGVYFWEAAPNRAWEWAQRPEVTRRIGTAVVVIGARIRIERCLDLTDTTWSNQIRAVYQALQAQYEQTGLAPPRQTPTGWHGWDKVVIDRLVRLIYLSLETQVGVVRGAFREPGDAPIFPGSGLYRGSHVQLAVRDQWLIEER